METFDRLVGRFSGLVGLVAGVGAVVTVAGGVISQVGAFPWYFRYPLIACVAVVVLVLVAQAIYYVRHRGEPRASQIFGPRMVHITGGSSDIKVISPQMRIGPEPAPDPVAELPNPIEP